MMKPVNRAESPARAFTLLLNRTADKAKPWTQDQNDILNDANFTLAKATISSWPGYAQTPLYNLPSLAEEAGVASVHYKDESGRFGLGSFKALGGAYAVARLLQREVERHLQAPVPMQEIVSGAHPDIVSGITVCCATDGNHGRSVAWSTKGRSPTRR